MGSKAKPIFIHGRRCYLKNHAVISATLYVLDRIKNKFPRDYARLMQRMVAIDALPKPKQTDRWVDCGEWMPLHDGDGEVEHGVVLLQEDPKLADHGVVAHEFGHAIADDEDRERCHTGFDEWTSELIADFYAYRW